ncbi:hypothetical protein HBB16_07060 [Pseudonocardia sp. MCCB 268]|nr:hypothetical protein [Pseudonocardia cytotoxica]
MDEHLLDALGYRVPPRPVRALADAMLRARAAVVHGCRCGPELFSLPASPSIRSYPEGYVRELGTFLACPVRHGGGDTGDEYQV